MQDYMFKKALSGTKNIKYNMKILLNIFFFNFAARSARKVLYCDFAGRAEKIEQFPYSFLPPPPPPNPENGSTPLDLSSTRCGL